MEGLFDGPAYWYWLAAGVLLIAIEAVLPGVFMVWLGVSAILTALVAVIFPEMGIPFQALVFALVSVATVLAGRRWLVGLNERSEQPNLNRRGAQHIGEVFTLDKPIRDGRGRVRVGDSTWSVIGPDLPAGARIRVAGVDGTTLKVERVD